MTDLTAYRQRVATVRGRARAQLAAIRKERLARMRMGPEATDPLAAAWVADQFADESGWRDVPARGAALALVPAAPAEEEAAIGSAERADDVGATQAEDGGPDLATATAAETHDVVLPEEEATDDGTTEAIADTGDDPIEPPDAVAPAPMEPADDPNAELAEVPVAHAADAAIADVTDTVAQQPEPGDTAAPSASSPLLVTDHAARNTAAPQAEPPSPDDTTDLAQIPGIGPGLIWMLREAGVATLADLARADAPDLARSLGAIARLLDLDWFISFARAHTQAR
jgi:predicted flap endonuclease-1-like 5' DNA nuclease